MAIVRTIISVLSSHSRNVSRASIVLEFWDLIQILIPFFFTLNFKYLNYPCIPQLLSDLGEIQ
jgi:hypothetical protein